MSRRGEAGNSFLSSPFIRHSILSRIDGECNYKRGREWFGQGAAAGFLEDPRYRLPVGLGEEYGSLKVQPIVLSSATIGAPMQRRTFLSLTTSAALSRPLFASLERTKLDEAATFIRKWVDDGKLRTKKGGPRYRPWPG